MHFVNLVEAIGFFPQVDIPIDGRVLDIRDFTITEINIDTDIQVILASTGVQVTLNFSNARIIEDNSTATAAVIGQWMLSLHQAQAFNLDDGSDILAFSLDFAVVQSWIISCSDAHAVITETNDA